MDGTARRGESYRRVQRALEYIYEENARALPDVAESMEYERRWGEGRNKRDSGGSRGIRLATAADREAIRQLVNQAFEIERFLKRGGGDRLQGDGELEYLFERGTFLVKEEGGAAEEDNSLAGCVYVEPRGDRAYLGLLSIAPARQGAGLGKQLNAAAEQFAREQGCRWMDLRVVSPRRSNSAGLSPTGLRGDGHRGVCGGAGGEDGDTRALHPDGQGAVGIRRRIGLRPVIASSLKHS